MLIGYFTWRQCTFFIISRSVLVRKKNFSKRFVDKIKTHISFSIIFFENRCVVEIRLKNIVEPNRPQMAIWCMRIACWIPKAKNTHSQYVTLTAFSTATMVARTRLIVTLHVHCLFCYKVPKTLFSKLDTGIFIFLNILLILQ